MTEEHSPNTLSRRTVVKAAAWSVPVIAAGSVAPAMAVTPTVLEVVGDGCKLSGNSTPPYKWGYTFGLLVTNPFPNDIELGNVVFTVDGDPHELWAVVDYKGLGECDLRAPADGQVPCGGIPTAGLINVCLGSGVSVPLVLVLAAATNSNNGLLRIDYSYVKFNSADGTCSGGVDEVVENQFVEAQLSGDTWSSGCRPVDDWLQGDPCDSVLTGISPPTGCIEAAASLEVFETA